MSDQLTIEVQEPPPTGRFLVHINDAPAVVTFEQSEAEEQPNSVLFTDGFDQAQRIIKPWQSLWMFGIKAISVIISSLFLSLLLFGLTEIIQTFQDRPRNPSIGAVNAEK